MTQLHSIVKNVLLPLCLDANAKAREKAKTDPGTAELFDKIKKIQSQHGINVDYVVAITKILAEVLDRPELNNFNFNDKKQPGYGLLCVMKYNDEFALVTHEFNRLYLGSDGYEDSYPAFPPLATDEEIESYLDGLTQPELTFILTSSRLHPFVASLFEDQTELVPADSLTEDDVTV